MKNLRKKAFTLIEISVVLVVIGIILASVMKGRDLIKSSQIKEFNQVFVSEWETIANSYFSRMAININDGGADHATTANIDGFMDTIAAGSNAIVAALQTAGINPCDLVKSDVKDATITNCSTGYSPFKRTVDGETIGKKTVTIGFGSATFDSKTKNYISFVGIPQDVAQAIDTIRDGHPDGTSGNIRNTTSSSAWDGDSTTATGTTMILILEH